MMHGQVSVRQRNLIPRPCVVTTVSCSLQCCLRWIDARQLRAEKQTPVWPVWPVSTPCTSRTVHALYTCRGASSTQDGSRTNPQAREARHRYRLLCLEGTLVTVLRVSRAVLSVVLGAWSVRFVGWADWVDCRCFLSFVFLGVARRLELSPCNTCHCCTILLNGSCRAEHGHHR